MHIPSSLLHGAICPVTASVSLLGVGAAMWTYHQSSTKESDLKWAGVTALIFALQMLNFPVTQGTSGHLLGGVLAAQLLGIPRAILSMTVILIVQAVFFADGGMSALGANIVNMALIGAGVGGLLLKIFEKRNCSQTFSLAAASFLSVMLATLACTLEVAGSGMASFGVMAKAMFSVHALIGFGEAVMTIVLSQALLRIFNTAHGNKMVLRTLFSGLAVIAISAWASQFPDGLEWTAQQLNLGYHNPISMLSLDHVISSTFLAKILGFALVWFCTIGIAKKISLGVPVGQK